MPVTRDPRLNILLVLTDQQRFDTIAAHVESFGVTTPAMDALVRRGVTFTNAFCTSPICCAARATLMTGRYPQQTGVYANLSQPCGPLDAGTHTIAKRMQSLGYQTAYHGKWHLGGDLADYGWDVAVECNHDESTVLEASRFYRNRDWMKFTQPFFGVVSLVNPHDVYFLEGNEERDPRDLNPWPNQHDRLEGKPYPQQWGRKADVAPSSDARIAYYREFYRDCVNEVDRDIARFMTQFTRGGYAPNTMVIFTSDHGDMAGEHGLLFKGAWMYEGVVRVPLIIAPPRDDMGGVVKCDPVWHGFRARRCDDLVSHIDLVPTILEIAGADPIQPYRVTV